jgi:single-stranded DNA-binding protein
MSAGLNQAIVMGKLLAAPEHISTKTGSVMLKATLEVSTHRRNADGKNEEQTSRVPITLFGKTATIFEQYVSPGDLVQVLGRLDGFERPAKSGAGTWLTLSFVVEQLILLPNGKREGPATTPAVHPAPQQRQFGHGFKPAPKTVAINELGEPDDIDF